MILLFLVSVFVFAFVATARRVPWKWVAAQVAQAAEGR